MQPLRCLALALAIAGNLPAQPEVHPDELKLKPKIDIAIEAGVEALIDRQLRDGTWGRYGNFDGGKTALCTYALVKCGVGVDHPAVRRGLLYLDSVQPNTTYSVACMMLAYAATGRPEHLGRVKQLAKLLLSWQLEGDYGYPFPHAGGDTFTRPDLSNTQYAALGMWIAQKHKVKIPSKVWRDLIEATLLYRAKPESVKAPTTGEHTTAGGKIEIRGFAYTRGRKPTGSMTTAGISILQICKIGLGSRLGKDRRRVEFAIDQGLAWLGHHFKVNANPGARGSWVFYYLYGLERVGSLTRVEKMGRHWWFVAGARHLLRAQRRDGIWRGQGAHVEVHTAFALLFLRRATGGSATTGMNSKNAVKRHLFAAGRAADPASIGGAGQQPLSLWIKGFGRDVKSRHEQHGIRVVRVEYLLGGRVLGQVVGDPTKAWTNDAFLYRVESLRRGTHRIRARIELVTAGTPPGQTTPIETIESPGMRVEIRDVFAKWMEVAAQLSSPTNLLRGIEKTVTATSGAKTAAKAVDGNDASHWICEGDDERPEISIEWAKPVSARKIVLTQAGNRGADRGMFDHILNVELFVNKDVKPLMIELSEDQMAVTTFELPARRKIRSLRLRIVARVPGRRAFLAGFSEIALMK